MVPRANMDMVMERKVCVSVEKLNLNHPAHN